MTGPMHILIVDDEQVIAEELAEYLTGRGATVTIAHDTEAALEQLSLDPDVDVLLSDIRMPGRDGLSLLSLAVANRDEAHSIEVVLMTGHATLDDAIAAVQRKAFDFVRKPFSLGELWLTLQRAHASACARRATAAAHADAGANIGRQVMAVLSHELRTPLVLIVGLGEMIEQDSGKLGPAELAEYGRLIRCAGERLSTLTEMGLTLAALESGTLKASLRPVLPQAVLTEVADVYADALKAAGQQLTVVCGLDQPIAADRPLLVRALGQLLANAIKFSPAGSTVCLCAKALPDGTVFRVSDQGSGTTTAQMDIALRPFRQIDSTLARRHEGLGLGLNLADSIARAMGGRLTLQSAGGQGTTAAVVLPASPPPLGMDRISCG